jgi:hypothetical protein
MDSRAQIHITNGATLLSGKMTFVHELIKTPISAYAGAVEQSRGKGFLPTRAVEPLDSKLIVSLVSEKESKYSKMYREYIVSFVSFSADRYRALKWNGDDLRFFARPERERIRRFRTTVHDLFEARCMIHAWISCDDSSKSEQIERLRMRVTDGINTLQSLYFEDPLVAVVGSASHLNDSYFRLLQRPQRRPSPWQFGKCMFPDCPTDAVHITGTCPGLTASVGRAQPLKADDDVRQGWDRDAYSAAVNALVRCGLAGLMPPSVD